jgi:tripartite-type tricarboxylate transporter receptor subunit TctC
MMHRRLIAQAALTGALAVAWAVPSIAFAQTYPVRPVRVIVGFAAGGATDIAARALAQKLSESLGQQVIVDNRPGGASMVAAETVARAAPDGHTMLFANATIAMPSLFAKLGFDVQKDLRPLTLVGYGPLALTAHPSLPVTSVKELVGLARKRPGDLNFASAGAGSFTHLAMELFITMTATKLVHVPYKGGGPSVIATMAGETQLTFASVGASIPPVKQGRLRALAVSGLKRSLALPDVPSLSEAGVQGYDATSWYGMLAPSATPLPVISRIGQEAIKALADAQLRERLLAQGIEPATGGVEEFGPYFDSEVVKWAKVIRDAAIPPQ